MSAMKVDTETSTSTWNNQIMLTGRCEVNSKRQGQHACYKWNDILRIQDLWISGERRFHVTRYDTAT